MHTVQIVNMYTSHEHFFFCPGNARKLCEDLTIESAVLFRYKLNYVETD